MGKITLKDIDGIEFEIATAVIDEVHRCKGRVTIVDRDGNSTIIIDSMEELINKIIEAKFGEA